MALGLAAFGGLSIFYYGLLVKYTKRWNSTFSLFWLLFGIANIAGGFLVRDISHRMEKILTWVFAAGGLLFFAVEILILCAMVSVVPKKLKYIVILGAQIRGTAVTESLKRRLDRGVRYLEENPETIVIVSGGQGKGEDISEARAMADYLQQCGIAEERIRIEEKSTSTYENLENSIVFIRDEQKDKVGIVTNNFHIYRSMKLAKEIGYRKCYPIAASSNFVVFPNYMVREFFAVLALFGRLRKNRRNQN